MKSGKNKIGCRPAEAQFHRGRVGSLLAAFLVSSALLVAAPVPGAAAAPDEHRNGKAVFYLNEKIADGPWSIHLVKSDRGSLERTNAEYEWETTLANGMISGMTTLSEQVKALSPDEGRPIVAINGDFYHSDPKPYRGDPQGLQILQGELVSGPSDHACFWIDPVGKPHTSIVQPLFRVTWPGGTTTPFGLNEERPGDGAVLYTPTLGPSSGTKSGGRELILQAVDPGHWLPMAVGVNVSARVLEVREAGDTALKPDLMVLSLGPQLLVDAPIVRTGDVVQLSTATVPDLVGCKTAIGGGPRLVVDGKPVNGWKSPTQRHPRTAIGWNDDYLFLVLVDGRQPGLSVGMSFQELAAYFLKLGCTQAVNLDGGGSASMWAFGQVVSSPSEGQERPIANALVLVKKPRKDPR